jgi:hypothetical protein
MSTTTNLMTAVTDLDEHTQSSQRDADQRLVNWADAVKRGDITETSMYWRLQDQIIDARARLSCARAEGGQS